MTTASLETDRQTTRAVGMATTAAATTMRAIVQRRYGSEPEEVLHPETVAIPGFGDHEVLIRVRAAGVDRGTWHLMAGTPHLMRFIGFGVRGPRHSIPGLDVAGTVEAVGSNVTDLTPGQHVFGTGNGAFAEYATARADRLATMPATLSFEAAAAVPTSATAALQAVRDNGAVQPGQHVLVIGASGGVGSYAVQIAKSLGAEVTAVCSAAKMDMVSGLGADHVIDYQAGDFAGGRRYDAIIDIGGNRSLRELRRALTDRGTLVITGGENGGALLGGIERNLRAALLTPFIGQRLRAFVARQRRRDLLALRELIESGAVTPPVDRTFGLDDAAAAVRYLIDGRARGKVVITV